MKIEQLSKNSYRVRKQFKGEKVTLYFDHKPSDKEVIDALSSYDTSASKGTFEACARSYLASKSNVLSPSTLKGYTHVFNAIPDDFKNIPVSRIEQTDVQTVINNYAADHKPKTVRNLHGFISAVLRQYRPNLTLYTTLPQKTENERYTPSEDDIKRILEAVKGKPFYHIPFSLGVMGMRRSEICALTLDDIEGNTLTINKALVKNINNQWVLKTTKTTAGTRKIYIPDSLVKEIQDQGEIYNGYPNSLLWGLNNYQDKLGIPRFRFHDLRHFFASYAHSQGISDADIMASGGWKSDFTMKSIYRHQMKATEAQKKIYNSIIK